MISLSEAVIVKSSVEDAFRFIANFTSAAEWDPQVVSARRITNGVIGVGTKFDLLFRIGPKIMPLVYEITKFEAPSEIILIGTGAGFRGTDRILFETSEDGTRISYTADLEFPGADSILAPLVTQFLQPLGKNAVKGLKRCLDRSGGTKPSFVEAVSDRLVLPAMVGFSDLGYRLRRRTSRPIDGRLDGKVVVVTGVTSGLGVATSRAIAELGAKVALVGRDHAKLDIAKKELEILTGRKEFTVFQADLSEPKEVEVLAETLASSYQTIDVLIHNAGVLAREYQENSEGTEQSVAVNLIAPYILTTKLQPRLKAAGKSRVILVSSGGMYLTKFVLSALMRSKNSFDGVEAYAQAKRAQVMLAEIWGEAFRSDHIAVHSMHPGWADTPGVERSLPSFYRLTKPILRSPEHGADTVVWLAAASDPAASTGQFWHDRRQRKKYLAPGTMETKQEREKLIDFLHEFSPSARD